MIIAGQEWTQLTDEDKEPWNEKAQVARDEYIRAKAESEGKSLPVLGSDDDVTSGNAASAGDDDEFVPKATAAPALDEDSSDNESVLSD